MRALPLLLVLLLAAPAVAGTAAPTQRARIAVLDTGIDASHPEFASGQVVAWRDYVGSRSAPYDDHGHGTATASLAAGANVGTCGSDPKLSFAPGAPLIIAKVLDAAGILRRGADLADAIDWAVAEGASVVSISIGSQGGVPPASDARDVEAAVRRAADAGVLVFVSAGNGRDQSLAQGTSVHTPWLAWARSFGNLGGVVSVGSAPRTAVMTTPPRHNLDPDVVSWGYNTCVGTRGGAYGIGSGTSYATPLVAGMVASAVDAAREAGQPHDGARLKTLVLHSSTNRVASPYTVEGLGWLLETEAARIRAHAAAGTLPDYDAQGAHAAADRQQHERAMPLLREPPTERS